MISVGSVSVDVVPSAEKFAAKLRAQVVPDADRIGRDIGQALADRVAKGIKEGLGGGFAGSGQAASAAGRDSGDKFAGEFDRQVQTKIRAALKSLPPLTVGVATTEAEQKIRDLQADLLTLSGQRIGVDIDEAAARAEIERIRAELERLGAESPSVRVKMDTAKAAAELALLQREIDKVDGDKVEVKADADTAGATAKLLALGAAARSAAGGGGVNGLLVAGLALGPAIIPVAAACVAALAAVGTAAAGAAAGAGVAFLALKPIVGAVQALGAQANAGQNAAQQAATANAIASANAQVASSERALANTRAQVASQAVNAAQAVADARRALGDAERQSAQGIQSSLLQVTTAEQSLANAQRQEQTAQQNLTLARKAAQQQLEDYKLQLADGALAQRAATLAIERAQQNLATVKGNPASTKLQREEAQLAYDQAVQHNVDLGVQQDRLKATADQAAKAGVDGARQVVAAKQGVTQANQGVANSEAALARAQQAVVTARLVGAEQVAKAQEAVAKAQQAASAQARQGAYSVAQAQQGVVNAQRSLHAAYAQSGAAGAAAANKVQQAFAKLTPAGAEFARFIFGLRGALLGLSGAAQNGFLPGLETAIKNLLPVLPGLTKFVGDLATVMGDLFVQASKALTGPFWTQFFDFISKNAGGWLITLAQTFGQLITGTAGLFQALAPVADLFNGALLRGATAFADWATSLGSNTGFQTFLGYITDNLPLVLTTLGDLGKAFGDILVALAPLGPVIIQVIDWVAKLISGMRPEDLRTWAAGLAGVAVAVALIASPVVLVTAAVALLVAGFIYAYNHFETFRSIVDGVREFIMKTLVPQLQEGFGQIVGFFGTVISQFKDGFGQIIGFFRTVIQQFSEGWGQITSGTISAWQGIGKFLTDTWDWIKTTATTVWQNIVGAIGNVWNSIVDTVKGPLNTILTFINDKFISPLQSLLDTLHVSITLPKLPTFAMGGPVVGLVNYAHKPRFEAGGTVPGWSPHDRADNILARLTAGEYVLPVGAVRAIRDKLGGGFLEHLRQGMPGYANGGLIGTVGSAFSSVGSAVWNGVTGVAGFIADPIGSIKNFANGILAALGPSPFAQIAKAVLTSAGDGLANLVKSMLAPPAAPAGAPAGAAGPVPVGSAVGRWLSTVLQALAIVGQPAGLASTTLARLAKESGGNPNAINLWDSNALAGTPSKGLMQVIDPTFAAYRDPSLPNNVWDPLANIVASMRYAVGRYGSLASAYNRPGGYAAGGVVKPLLFDAGGYLPTGVSLVRNDTGRPEPLRPADGAASAPIEQHNYYYGITDPERLSARVRGDLTWALMAR